jgi:hypothetical protein
VNALTNHQVGQYLNRHFVSAFQKVATFQINGGAKQGGNVAAYFCTSAGLVLHAVAGPVDADTFLQEARWANETYQLAQLDAQGLPGLRAFFRQAHFNRLRLEHDAVPNGRLSPLDAVTSRVLNQALVDNDRLPLGNQGKVHLVLGVGPVLPLGQVYRVVFETILGEKISTDPVAQK